MTRLMMVIKNEFKLLGKVNLAWLLAATESSLSFYLVKGGAPIGLAIIVTLLYRLLSFWLPMPIGTYFYKRWLASRSP